MANITQSVFDQLAAAGPRAALTQGNRVTSAGALAQRTATRMARLQAAGFQSGDRAIVHAPPGAELAVSALAVLGLGGVLVMAEPSTPPPVLKRQAQLVQPNWYLVDRTVHWLQLATARLPVLRGWLERRQITLPEPVAVPDRARVITHRTTVGSLGAPALQATPVAPDVDAVIVFTGGTTNAPKGVRLSHRALAAYLASIAGIVAEHQPTCCVAGTPQQILYGLYLGLPTWLPASRGGDEAAQARAIAAALTTGQADMFFGPPSIWQRIVEQTPRAAVAARTRLIMLGGAPVSNALLRRIRAWQHDAPVRIIYGLTEVGPVCLSTLEDRLAFDGQGDLLGAPLPGIRLEIDAPGTDGVGELLIDGPSVYSGYVGEAARTTALRTGDLARLVPVDGAQQLVLMGRSKDMIVRRGVNIYPGALEPVMLALTGPDGRPLLNDCSLVGIWDDQRQDERLILFMVTPATGPTVAAAIDQALASDLRPDQLLRIDAIPTTGRAHKPDKAVLRKMAATELGLRDADEAPVRDGAPTC